MKLTNLLPTCVFLAVSVLTFVACAESNPVAELSEIDWLIGTWIQKDVVLENDAPGFGKKGETFDGHIEYKYTSAAKIFMHATSTVKRDGKEIHVYHQFLGRDGETGNIRSWRFDNFMGQVWEGLVYIDDDTVTTKIAGRLMPKGEQMTALIGKEVVSYSAVATARKVDEDTLGEKVDKVMVNGKPFPLPGVGKESLFKRQK